MKKNLKIYGELYYRDFGEHPPILRLQIGNNLIHLMDETNRGTPLVTELQKCRNYFDEEYGLTIPNIRISENKKLEPDEYVFEMNGAEVCQGNIKSSDKKNKAPEVQIEEHVQKLIKENITRILNQNLVVEHINKARTVNPEVTDDVLFKKSYPIWKIKTILNGLLAEDVSIRDMSTILETIAEYSQVTENPQDILVKEREMLSLEILSKCSDKSNVVHGIVIAQDVVNLILENTFYPPDGSIPQIALDPSDRKRLFGKIGKEVLAFQEKGFGPIVFLCPQIIRSSLSCFLKRHFDKYVCISDMELQAAGKTYIFQKEGEINFE